MIDYLSHDISDTLGEYSKGQLKACAAVPTRSDRACRFTDAPYIRVIEPVFHEDPPEQMSAAEAACVVAHHEAGFVEMLIRGSDVSPCADSRDGFVAYAT